MEKQKKYALRKIAGYGLVSCAVGILLIGGNVAVNADEDNQPITSEISTIIENGKVSETENESTTPDIIHTVVEAEPTEESETVENVDKTNVTEADYTSISSMSEENKVNDVVSDDKVNNSETSNTAKEADNKTEETNPITENKEKEAVAEGLTPTENQGKVRSRRSLSLNEDWSTFDFSDWEKIDNATPTNGVVINYYNIGDTKYKVETHFAAPLALNIITNLETNESFRYTFYRPERAISEPNRVTSSKIKDTGNINFGAGASEGRYNYFKYYKKVADDGKTVIGGEIDYSYGAKHNYKEIVVIDDDGTINHTFIRDLTYSQADNTMKIAYDIELNNDDHIPMIADGEGGSYVFNGTYVLHFQPVENVLQYVNGSVSNGMQIDIDTATPSNAPKGTVILDKKDSTLIYTGKSSEKNNLLVMKWKEKLYDKNDLRNLDLGVFVNYLDTNGNKLADTIVKMDGVGREYTTEEKQFNHYTLVSKPDNSTGVYTSEAVDVNYIYRKDNGTVTANYVDENNEKIADSTVLTGDFDAEYNTTAKQIKGYVLKTEPQNKSGVFGTGNTTVTYVYKKNIGNVTVSYVGEDGTKLADNTVISGVVGDSYQTNAKDIDNYTLKSTPNNSKGTYTEGSQNVTYVYAKKTGSITAHYVNEDGEKVAEDTSLSGTFDQDYSLATKDIENYTLKTKPQVTSGKFGTDSKEVNFVYSKKKGTITIKYLDEGGTRLADDTVKSGTFDQDYQAQPKEIANYNLKTSPTNQTGKYGTTNQELIYIYSKKTAKVTVHYVGEDGSALADDVVMSGTFDQDYQAQPKEIVNYNLKTSPTNATGKFGTSNQEMKYIYSKKTAKVTVHYVGEDGAKLADDVVLSGTFDQDYQAQPKNIENYNLKTSPTHATGKYGTTNQELNYVYAKKTAKVTVHYVGEDGTKLVDDVVMSGTFDQDYQTQPKDIANYNLKTSPTNQTGKYGIVNQEFSYVYSKKRASVTVRYVDESGKELAKPVIFEGTFDETWEAKPATLTYYFVSKKPVAEKGLFGIKNQTIDYVYGKRSATVMIHYVNQEGEVLAEPVTLSGVFDDSWNSEAKEIENYEILSVPEEQSGLFGIEDQELTYTYMKKRAQVGIRYVNEAGQDIYPDETLEGNFDETWESHAQEIKNWELVKAPEKESGKYGTEDQMIEYVYKKKRGKVTVQFLDENGKPLADSQVFEGVFDDPYEFSSRAFDGYELVESPKETKGFLETGERTFTFKYKKKATPQPEVKPIAQETPKQPELPKAGSEDVSTITSLLGMIMASFSVLLFWKKRKRTIK